MYQYLVKRTLLMVPTLLGAAFLVFFLMRMIPGDVCELRMAGSGTYVDQEAIDACREDVGLTKPVYLQFYEFVSGYFTGDLGKSMWTGRPVTEEIALRFKLSLQLAIMTTFISVLIAIPLGREAIAARDRFSLVVLAPAARQRELDLGAAVLEIKT